jgi:hypothetical protein
MEFNPITLHEIKSIRKMEDVVTRYAPAARVPLERIVKEYEAVRHIKYIQEILDALPYIGAILNFERQVIYSNQTLLNLIGVSSIDRVLGRRPGEIIQCIHSAREPGGCGTSENCKVCGAIKTILDCQENNTLSKGECRITSMVNGITTFFDFLVTVKPISISGSTFFILTLSDISNEKRRKALEKIFFHDVLNMAGSLNGFFNLIRETNDLSEFKELLDMAREVSHHLTDEVLTQRQILFAENGDLTVNLQESDSLEIIKDAISSIQFHDASRNRCIITEQNSLKQNILTDLIILRRVLVNMLKNALEAGSDQDEIRIGCCRIDQNLRFYVWNKEVMPDDVQMQVFQRSFSSKGGNRGIGTYSIKLLTEQYLKGRVGFESIAGKGTSFYIDLPLQNN